MVNRPTSLVVPVRVLLVDRINDPDLSAGDDGVLLIGHLTCDRSG